MNILSDNDILALRNRFEDLIYPFDSSNLQPSSYDLHLGLQGGIICPPVASNKEVVQNFGRVVLPPFELVLLSTDETVHIPKGYVGRVEGVSSLGRIGLQVHITAGFIDPNFKGHITLEVINLNSYPIILENGCRICQLCIEKLENPNTQDYDIETNHYQNQVRTTESKYENLFNGVNYFIPKGE